ncbi:MAG: acetylxylan esterase [Chloroflexota bacterium]
MTTRARFIVGILLSACATTPQASPSPAPTPTFASLTAQFDYERTAPIDLLAGEAESVAGVAVRSITFASPRGGRASALLFVPAGAGPFPAVVMMPGSNQPPASFRPTALEIATRGAIVLVADQSQTRPGHTPLFSFTAAEQGEFVQTVVDVRRGVDLLAARPDVDPQRFAFWGFSQGAFIGGIVAGVEPRIASYVLQSGGGADYLRTNAPQRLREPALSAYLATIAAVDPDLYIAHAAPSAVFLQNGSLDKTYTAAGVAAWQAASSEPKKIATYQADHALDAAATADALAWLTSRIRTR